jgi:hypothetical protein
MNDANFDRNIFSKTPKSLNVLYFAVVSYTVELYKHDFKRDCFLPGTLKGPHHLEDLGAG